MLKRDDLIVNDSYSVQAQHGEEEGKAIRKKIVQVTILLSVVTAIEVLLGVYVKQGTDMWPIVKWLFIVMTLIKAGYIVAIFMHLGDERKSLRYAIIMPDLLFIVYILFILITESNYLNYMWSTYF